MTFSSSLRLGAAAALTTIAFTLPAHAAVVISNMNTVAQAPAAATDTPTSLSGGSAPNIYYQDLTSSVDGQYRSPWEGTSTPGGQFNSISAGVTATYLFDWVQSSLSFMWGSPDSYNVIKFYNGDEFAGSFTGANVYTPNGPAPAGLGFANVTFTGAFDKFTMTSVGQNAFEYAKLEVPEPGSLALLGLALAGLATTSRRKQKQA